MTYSHSDSPSKNGLEIEEYQKMLDEMNRIFSDYPRELSDKEDAEHVITTADSLCEIYSGLRDFHKRLGDRRYSESTRQEMKRILDDAGLIIDKVIGHVILLNDNDRVPKTFRHLYDKIIYTPRH